MKNNRKKVNNANADILSTVSIVDGDEVVKRNNNEYIYLDAERGIIVQPEEVETVKNRQAVDVLKNLLLGSFNAETGKYEISNNIELELKEIVKTETSRKGNAVFCESLSSFGGLGKLQFVVKTTVEKGEALSQLFIFERVKKMSKTVVNTQIQLVAEYNRYNETYKDFDSLTFENYYRFAWEEFKIVKQNQMFYLSEDEKFLQGWIVRRKLYLKSMGLILDPYIDAAESELLLTRIEILSGLGTYGYKVLARFEELKNQAKKIVGGDELSARDQNEILEEAIETFRGKFEKEQTEFFKKQVSVVKDYAATVATVKEQNHKEVLNDIEVRMPTVVEIIKRDDEAKKIGAMARLDAEVASIEANSKPTTKQVAQNAKQAEAEQKGKTNKKGKAAATTEPAAEQKNAPAEAANPQVDENGKPVEGKTETQQPNANTNKPAQNPAAKTADSKPITTEDKPKNETPTISTWLFEQPAKKVEAEEKKTFGLDETIAAAVIASAIANAQEDEQKPREEDETVEYDYGSDYDYNDTSSNTISNIHQDKSGDTPPVDIDDTDPDIKTDKGPVDEETPPVDEQKPADEIEDEADFSAAELVAAASGEEAKDSLAIETTGQVIAEAIEDGENSLKAAAVEVNTTPIADNKVLTN